MNHWAIICPESGFPGLWNAWQQENLVSISFGSPQYLADHPDLCLPNGAYGFARGLVQQMQPGDQIVPFLRENRVGRVATFRSQRIDDWVPVLADDFGRRIEVVWQSENMPPAEKVALIPPDLRRAPIRRTVARLSPGRFDELAAVLADETTWQDLRVVRQAVDDQEIESDDSSQFALEMHLEEFIETNFARINFGRKLQLYQDDENTGRQFPTDIGSIDLLARDMDTREFVVIELKKSRSDDAVVGQVLRYMGWIREHMRQDATSVKGIIIVPEMSERLRYALSMVSDVEAFTYSVSFGLTAAA